MSPEELNIPPKPKRRSIEDLSIWRIWTVPDGQETVNKVKIMTTYSTVFGGIVGIYGTVLVKPQLLHQALAVMGRCILPFAASGAIYSFTTNTLGEIRGESGKTNHFVGGCLAGSTFGGMAASGAIYSFTTNTLGEIRGESGKTNHFVGGCLAGSTFGGMAASGAIYSFTTNTLGEIRGESGKTNHFVGGCLAGSTFGGMARSYRVAAGVGLLFAALGMFAKAAATAEDNFQGEKNYIKPNLHPNFYTDGQKYMEGFIKKS